MAQHSQHKLRRRIESFTKGVSEETDLVVVGLGVDASDRPVTTSPAIVPAYVPSQGDDDVTEHENSTPAEKGGYDGRGYT